MTVSFYLYALNVDSQQILVVSSALTGNTTASCHALISDTTVKC